MQGGCRKGARWRVAPFCFRTIIKVVVPIKGGSRGSCPEVRCCAEEEARISQEAPRSQQGQTMINAICPMCGVRIFSPSRKTIEHTCFRNGMIYVFEGCHATLKKGSDSDEATRSVSEV